MEKVATSSWGGNDLKGYVKWIKTSNADGRTTTTYYVRLADAQKHGMNETQEKDISRTSVATSGITQATAPADTDKYLCVLK